MENPWCEFREVWRTDRRVLIQSALFGMALGVICAIPGLVAYVVVLAITR